jgi:hypothetical protein
MFIRAVSDDEKKADINTNNTSKINKGKSDIHNLQIKTKLLNYL